ncbi:MAG: hypothetical protein II556_02330 [Bacteroidales bacterium]|nr:hypothetical protein [Bacteroidales bacterium]
MKEVFRYAFVALLFAVLSVAALAQDRNMGYYDSHPSEILPDAQAAFKKGDYEVVTKLCEWHYIITGSRSASTLRDKAMRCSSLAAEMNSLSSQGNTSAARDKARALQALNPDDPAARRILSAASSVSSSSSAASSSSGQGSSVSYSYVDLGLSVKWATCNLGATKPEEYGDYYAWGETETKTNYEWSTYKWCKGASDKLTKYCPSNKSGYWAGYGSPDGKTSLDLSDDVANIKLGGKWRLPTDAEWTELRERCEWTWTSTISVNGYKVTGPNGNSIFLPAAGCRLDTSLYLAGSRGYYRSSSLNTDSPSSAWYVNFNSDNVYRYSSYRYYGRSVRPVTE